MLMGTAALMVLFIVTQLAWPAFRNRPLFPVFNFRRKRLRRKLEELRAQEVDTKLALEAERLQIRVTDLELMSDAEVQAEYDELIRRQERK